MLASGALAGILAGGCAAVLGIDDDVEVIEPSASGASGGAGGQASTATVGGSGTGGTVTCGSPGECPGAELPCSVRTCLEGVCGLEPKPAGPLPLQTPGDCKRNDCDGTGNLVEAPDDADAPDDGEDCTTDGCESGTPTHVPVVQGAPCGQGLACNESGQCTCTGGDPTICGVSTACQTRACTGGVCVTTNEPNGTACGDHCQVCAQGACVPVPDGTDPNGDCGLCQQCQGGGCQPIPSGQSDLDFACPGMSAACNGNGQCMCDDDVENGGETGVDCGYTACGIQCPVGQGCDFGVDCATKCCNTSKVCGTCGVDCTCSAPDVVCKVGGVCGD